MLYVFPGYILEMAVALKHLTYAILVAVVVFSSIALILSLVRISNVFLPPKNKVSAGTPKYTTQRLVTLDGCLEMLLFTKNF